MKLNTKNNNKSLLKKSLLVASLALPLTIDICADQSLFYKKIDWRTRTNTHRSSIKYNFNSKASATRHLSNIRGNVNSEMKLKAEFKVINLNIPLGLVGNIKITTNFNANAALILNANAQINQDSAYTTMTKNITGEFKANGKINNVMMLNILGSQYQILNSQYQIFHYQYDTGDDIAAEGPIHLPN